MSLDPGTQTKVIFLSLHLFIQLFLATGLFLSYCRQALWYGGETSYLETSSYILLIPWSMFSSSHSLQNSLLHTYYVPDLSWRLLSTEYRQKINRKNRDSHVPKSPVSFSWKHNFSYHQMVFENPFYQK